MSDLYLTLKKKLKVCKLNSSQTEINIRCPFCKDSIKDPLKGHLYIQNGSPYKYYCQKCQSSGVVNSEFLELLEVTDYSLINKIQIEYKEYKKKSRIKYGESLNFLNNKQVYFPEPKIKKDFIKKEYLEKRLGVEFTNEDLNKFKIVLSLKEFLRQNNLYSIIENNKNNKFFMKNIFTIEENCIGFLSTDKSIIIFRSLDKSLTGYRYNNFALFPDISDSKKTYTISNQLDMTSSLFEINIAEGPIDIIGVYNNVKNKEMKNNNIYIANAGKSFTVTSNFIKKLGILNTDINIYSDKDVDLNFYKHLMKIDPFYQMNGINIYYNNKNKDFGVTKDEIELSRKIIL